MDRTRSRKPKLEAGDQIARPKPPLRWTPGRRRQLLACLNWCVTYGKDFFAVAGGYLGPVIGEEISKKQIRRRLYREWRNNGRCASYKELCEIGTTGLNLSEEEEKAIGDIVTSINNPFPRALRSRRTPVMLATPRKLSVARLKPRIKLKITVNRNTANDKPAEEPSTPPVIEISGSPREESNEPAHSPLPLDDAVQAEVDATCPNPTPEQLHDTTNPQEDELLKLKSENFRMTHELLEKRREIDELRRCDDAQGVGEPQLRKTISYLKGQLDLQRQLPEIPQDGTQNLRRLGKKIENGYRALDRSIQGACEEAHPDKWQVFPLTLSEYIATDWSIPEGPQKLRHLDITTLESIVPEEAIMKGLTPPNVNSLAEFILRTLRFFLPPKSQNIGLRPSHDHEMNASKSLDNTLSEALSLRLQLAKSTTHVKFFFFKPDAPFNPETMRLQDRPRASNLPVRLCLLPALFVRSVDEDTEALEDAISGSDPNHNRYLKEAREEDLESLSLLAKAVVVL
ncbi:hypothetical protein FALBO_9307 [Fusarium albosuccineum]|uniref:Uncharacterized protein n=1 Tax=Fusarium albosuccineum TaxID=1237068 RepID=A0A8H4L6B5_9HYPO|nr:hypothetical protein FALBO_9307 [Fusarium albosuccineum]